MSLEPGQLYPNFTEWSEVYSNMREYCAIAEAVQFIRDHPGTVNNRGGESKSTILHQAVYWGVGAEIISELKDLGADPTIMNSEGRTALDFANSAAQRQEMEAIFTQVFGDDDQHFRQVTLNAARAGNFVIVMRNLRQRPHLVNTQRPDNGWSLMHQVAFHGASVGLVAALTNLGASWDLRTRDGKTPAMVLEETHPSSTLVIPGSQPTVYLEVGSQVLFYSKEGTTMVVLESVSNGCAQVRTSDAQTQEVPLWRIGRIKTVNSEVEGVVPCFICHELVPPKWNLSSECSGDAHPMCGDCIATFLWSQFTTPKLPIRCSVCDSLVDLENLPRVIDRGLSYSWPPGRSSGHPCTHLSWGDFVANVKQKIDEGQHTENRSYNLRLLLDCRDIVLEYCGARAPCLRACPGCGVVIEYASACKHFSCTICRHKFCWLCLRTEAQHTDARYNWSYSHACPVAPRQTEIPNV